MKALLLIAALVLVVGGDEAFNPSPCMKYRDSYTYWEFVHNHVLQEQFNTSSIDKWKSYLKRNKLCDRPTQSFIDKGVENLYVDICNGFGKRRGKSSLCTSTYPVLLHDLNVTSSDWSCRVDDLRSEYRYVTVNCDMVANQCLPVHFESSQVHMPDDRDETCRPYTDLWFKI